MADKTTICNVALSLIGTRSTIASIDEQSAEASVCKIHYDMAREEILRAGRFNFSNRRLSLTDLGSPPDDWSYRYAYPDDCVVIRYLVQTTANVATQAPQYDYEVGLDLDDSGNQIKVVYTNVTPAVAVYTANVTNPSLFDPGFAFSLACLLASRIAVPLTGSQEIMTKAYQLYSDALRNAQAQDGNEGVTDLDSKLPDWIVVRGISDGGANSP